MRRLTYKSAGVDIETMDGFKGKIKSLARKSFTSGVLKDIGGFGSFFALPQKKYKEPVLVSSADGVGTKLKIAILADTHDTVGIDAVAMNVNDILCTGALPLFFLDYISFSSLKAETLFAIVKGINEGCLISGCSLIGGETAQMPGMYRAGDYDIAGFCVGIVEKTRIIEGSKIEAGNTLIGLESNGLHSNGFSLVRKVFSERELKRMSRELLKPTRIYVKQVASLLRDTQYARRNTIRGIAHITGGAFFDKIARILPDTVSVRIRKNSWTVPKLFQLIQNKGNIQEKEMYHTLNMGIGMVLFVADGFAGDVIEKLKQAGQKAWVIGKAVKGNKQVEVV